MALRVSVESTAQRQKTVRLRARWWRRSRIPGSGPGPRPTRSSCRAVDASLSPCWTSTTLLATDPSSAQTAASTSLGRLFGGETSYHYRVPANNRRRFLALLAAMSAAGAQLMNWFSVACELHRDWRNDIEGLGNLLSNHIPNYRNLISSYMAKSAARK